MLRPGLSRSIDTPTTVFIRTAASVSMNVWDPREGLPFKACVNSRTASINYFLHATHSSDTTNAVNETFQQTQQQFDIKTMGH